ncbi:RagB/SusD family nutrient uptake outer membrane protein [Pedobacter deserti]|uniref:RagB/SusD family nutrient uptake outer membrane protein n=1 Tax=Pedobacter deserti TaxID=2817382 RepID=UPI00210BBC5C|nr:RagB/SusD family nutrient uptake outer membrane protein [Pedobacter sp. SYSU D00382]
MKARSFNKNIFNAGYLLIMLGILASCKKLVELPGNPPSFINREQQFADSASVMSVVAGVYTYNQSKGFGYSDANFTIATGLSADELSTTLSSSDRPQFYNYSLTPLNGSIIGLWQYPYQALYQVNDVLEGISDNNKLSASLVNQLTGEMKVLRALYYFNLVNIFGGVPLVTSTDYRVNARLPRASVDAVYAQITADLNDALNRLSPDYPSEARYRPNLYTAKALLAKVYLYQGKWQAAYDEADDVVGSNVYRLSEVPLNAVFLDGSEEAIWQIPAKNSYQQTAEAQNFIPSGASTPRYLVTPFLLNKFEAGDQRRQRWVGTTVVNGNPLSYPAKYRNRQATNLPLEGYMILRLAEVLLIRAEAAARLNNLANALSDVDIIRERAGLEASTADVTSQDAVLNAIMHERQVELCFEWGNRWFDLKRNVTPSTSAATVLNAVKAGYTPEAALYPVPQAQRDLNTSLDQNDGYR